VPETMKKPNPIIRAHETESSMVDQPKQSNYPGKLWKADLKRKAKK